jgi:hypothetical protein
MPLSPEDKQFIKQEYADDPTTENIDFLRKKFSVSTRTIKAVLTAAGLYTRAPYLTKTGELPVSKEHIINYIASSLRCPPEEVESLSKVTKPVLRMILRALDPGSDDYFKH